MDAYLIKRLFQMNVSLGNDQDDPNIFTDSETKEYLASDMRRELPNDYEKVRFFNLLCKVVECCKNVDILPEPQKAIDLWSEPLRGIDTVQRIQKILGLNETTKIGMILGIAQKLSLRERCDFNSARDNFGYNNLENLFSSVRSICPDFESTKDNYRQEMWICLQFLKKNLRKILMKLQIF